MSEGNGGAVKLLPLIKMLLFLILNFRVLLIILIGKRPPADGSLAGSPLHSGDTMINLVYNVKQKYLLILFVFPITILTSRIY